MVEAAFHHRPTLKQQNKPFKSKHATRRSIKEAAKGKIARTSKAPSTTIPAAQLRLNRKNNAKQAQAKKRSAIVSATQIFSGVGGAPRIVAVVPLSEDVNAKNVVGTLAKSLEISAEECPQDGLWKMRADRFKTSLQFRPVPYRNFYDALDACKVADYVLFALSPKVEVDAWGDTLLRSLQAQGLPEVVSVVSPDASVDAKTRSGINKSLLSFMQYFVPSQTRVFDLHSSSDRINALRALSEGKPGDPRWRDGRTWMLGESVEWEDGTLKVTGVVRGAALSANRLVHLPNFGDYQISKILSAPLPHHDERTNGMEVEPNLLAEPNVNDADSLVSSNDPDDTANEQTWPTAEEMNNAPDDVQSAIPDAPKGTTPRIVKRIPKGMSEYQAAWIVDETDDEDGEDGEGSDPEMREEEEEEMVDLVIDEDKDMDMGNKRDVEFEDLDLEEEDRQLAKWRDRQREEEDDLRFPDELDTPQDAVARTRFQRYRGMRSFRTSPWDPYENLPRDYARIFQFEDFKRTEHNVRRKAEDESNAVEPGARVTIHIRDVPQDAGTKGSCKEIPNTMAACDQNQHTRGGGKGANNVHKFERYFRHGVTNVATTYGPIIYGSQPCLLLRETADLQAPQLVAMGSFLSPDTTRIIAKRIILTGHPFKVHKKTATVRYMFFNPDDVLYFKPIQLHTKHGRTGHIRESLGTHGYFKAHFDGPINQMDTVCMSLYKRVYPKWSRLWREQERTVPGHDHQLSNSGQLDDAMEE
ncbi:hypothetical protein AN958_03540 [Leucoagaricus sp. SymC.cos]|nr:hypothetical protein AN958_03540 [Leucoagaricus sp. SymC.cos]